MIIKLLVDGGEMKPGPTVGQQLGPTGINIGEVISKVNQETSQFKGTKVPVTLDVDVAKKEFTVSVSSPPTSELLKKDLGLEKASGDHKKEKVANASIEQVISVSKTKHNDMLSRDFKATVKSVLGTCTALGILVEGKEGNAIIKDIDKENSFETEINDQKSETSPEKVTKLKKEFDQVVKAQELAKKEEEEAVKAAEEAKAEEAKAAEAEEGAEPVEKEEEGAEGEKPAEGDEEEKPEKPTEGGK